MKKIILLLLLIFTSVSYGQTTLANKLKITGNVTDNVATKVNVQDATGLVNTIAKSDLIEYLEYASAINLPVTGVAGKIYLTLDNNTLYRWNGTIYTPITADVSGKANDNEVVHLAGAETITGMKAFTSSINSSTSSSIASYTGTSMGSGEVYSGQSSSSGGIFKANITGSGTGFNFIGQNNGINTFFVNKAGDIFNSGNFELSNGAVFISSDLPAQIQVKTLTDPNKQLLIGYNNAGNYATIDAIQQGVGYRPLILQPVSGSVIIGTTANNGSKFQVNGDITGTSFIKSGGLNTEFLMADGSVSLGGGGGSGDMVLATAQTVTGEKTFLDTKLSLRNVANTFSSYFTNANTASRTYTLQNKTGILAHTTDFAFAPLDEGNGIGWVINGRDPANYGNVGLNAVDLGFSESASTTRGATGNYSSVSGGQRNIASGMHSNVGGGADNKATNTFASVGGGYGNTASGQQSAVIGGDSNQATAQYSFVSGGTANIVSGVSSSVSGGESNRARSYGEWVGGFFGTDYTPLSTTAFNALDRLFNIGNGTITTRSNAFTILKNGLATLPSVTNTLIQAETTGKAVVTKEYIKSKTGWANYSTTTYTSVSPFSISPSTTVTLPNDANNSITTDLPLGVTSFYDGTTNKITPNAIGDAYTVNVRFKAKTTTNNDYLTLYIDIGSGAQINAEAKQFLKGANTEQAFSFTLPIFTLATFVSNGGLIKITSNTGTISVYDITYFITRNYTR